MLGGRLDQPGEWWYNTPSHQLFYWHNSTIGESQEAEGPPPADLQLVAGNLTTLIQIRGTMKVCASCSWSVQLCVAVLPSYYLG